MVSAYCTKCRMVVADRVEERVETFPVKGEQITVRTRVAVCPRCGDTLFCEELDEANLAKAFEAYRKRRSVKPPGKIKGLPELAGRDAVGTTPKKGDKVVSELRGKKIIPKRGRSKLR